MSTNIDNGFRTFSTSSAISAYRLVQPSTVTAGGVDVAVSGATKAIGSTIDIS